MRKKWYYKSCLRERQAKLNKKDINNRIEK